MRGATASSVCGSRRRNVSNGKHWNCLPVVTAGISHDAEMLDDKLQVIKVVG
jgi:hypothetical protein